jgi:tRNA nucleotidyltransferase (CCA-adding enzyme)
LHTLSFIEDPTRILRAVRYGVRLDFTMDPTTAEQVPRALPLFARLSAARLRTELLRVFHEPDPAAVLAWLADLGVLSAIQPQLAVDRRLAGLLADLPETWRLFVGRDPAPEDHLALWLATNGPVGQATAVRLKLSSRQQSTVSQALTLLDAAHPVQTAGLSPFLLWRSLSGLRPEALALADLAGRSAVLSRNLRHYQGELAGQERPITGDDLTELGVPPGPAFRRILDAVWAAWLDGQLANRQAALDLARHLADGEGSGR